MMRAFFTFIFAVLWLPGVFAQTTIYVKKSAAGNNDGKSWVNAYTELADALIWAHQKSSTWTAVNPLRIYVAAGTYKPKYSPADDKFGEPDGRKNSFLIPDYVQVYGGFPAEGNPDWSARDPKLQVTLLSGDIDNSNTLTDGDVYHVVMSVGKLNELRISNSSLLDGFVISGGNGNKADENDFITVNTAKVGYGNGGGIHLRFSDMKLSNLVIRDNTGIFGGGLFNAYSSPLVEKTEIRGNRAVTTTVTGNAGGSGGGGGGGRPRSLVLRIAAETIGGVGGGIYTQYGAPRLSGLVVENNSALDAAGGLYTGFSDSQIAYTVIRGNSAVYGGGGVYCGESKNTFKNVLIAQNTSNDGGGIHLNKSQPVMINTTIAGNTNTTGTSSGGVYNRGDSSPILHNSVIYGNSSGVHNATSGSAPVYNYSLVQGVASGGSGYVSYTGPANNVFTGPGDGDFTVKNNSPVINRGSNQAYIDAGGNPAGDPDLAGNSRVYDPTAGGVIDLGAYEYQGPSIRYVREGGTGSGLLWTDASGSLQQMIDAPGVTQVWVAAGTYNAPENGFAMKNNVAIYGGFPAAGSPAMTDRNWNAYQTTLSGEGHRRIISNEFIEGIPLTSTARLDGFVLTGGRSSNNPGGAIYNRYASPTLANIIFKGNTATLGGAIANYSNSSPTLLNVLITGNTASSDGGGVYHSGGAPLLTNVTISGNTAGRGSDWFNAQGLPIIRNSILYGEGSQSISGEFYNYQNSLIKGHNSTSNGNIAYTGPVSLLFANPGAGDYSLNPFGPAINAGSNQAYIDAVGNPAGDHDLAGNSRVYDLTAGGLIDLGAYEFPHTVTVAGDGSTLTRPFASGVRYLFEGGKLFAMVETTGANAPTGYITVRTGASGNFISHGKIRYSGRYYNISPESYSGPAIVTLFFTGEDFDAYNTAFGNDEDNPPLPGRLKIGQYRGEYTVVGSTLHTADTPNFIEPVSVEWRGDIGLWEVVFHVEGFSAFFITGQDDGSLPVSLAGFTASLQEQAVLLTWQTTAETNVSRFEIERSPDSRSWEMAGAVPAAGESSRLIRYHYRDIPFQTPVLYYRLKMIDYDGTYSYSAIRSVMVKENPQNELILYPNPAADRIYLRTPDRVSEVTLRDLTGRTLRKDTSDLHKGIPVAGLAPGITLAEILYSDGRKEIVKVVIGR